MSACARVLPKRNADQMFKKTRVLLVFTVPVHLALRRSPIG
jgi:hypothetical protein